MSDLFSELFTPVAYQFKCLHCDETFNIHFLEMLNIHTVACPNCKAVMDDKISLSLQSAVESINMALNYLKESNAESSQFDFSKIDTSGFTFLIKWPESKQLPTEGFTL